MSKEDETPWLAFFATIKHEHFDEIITILQEYNIQGYIVSRETSKSSHQDTEGQHMHFVVQMTSSDYKRFSDRIFIKRFKLRGRATKGLSRQYGKVNNIENLERMKAYTLKDGDFKTNLSTDEIDKLINIAFEKNEERAIRQEVLDYLKEEKPDGNNQFEIELAIVNYVRKNKIKKSLSKKWIDGIVVEHCQSEEKYSDKTILWMLGYRNM